MGDTRMCKLFVKGEGKEKSVVISPKDCKTPAFVVLLGVNGGDRAGTKCQMPQTGSPTFIRQRKASNQPASHKRSALRSDTEQAAGRRQGGTVWFC